MKGWVKNWAELEFELVPTDEALEPILRLLENLPAPQRACVDIEETKQANAKIMCSKIKIKIVSRAQAPKVARALREVMLAENYKVADVTPKVSVEPEAHKRPMIVARAKCTGNLENWGSLARECASQSGSPSSGMRKLGLTAVFSTLRGSW